MIILASASPRRKQLLENAGLEFIVRPAENEITPDNSLPPEVYAMKSARGKALEAAADFGENDIVLGADTIVCFGGEIIGKPKDKTDAKRVLKMLSGNTHKVFTGYTLVKSGKIIEGYEVTEVTFRTLDETEICDYVNSGEPMDKAGSYGVQGKGCVFVSRISGDFYNVMGLPICAVYKAIKSILIENQR